MRAATKRHSRLKQGWLRALRAGAGSLVVAAAVIGASTASASTPPPQASIAERVQHAREALLPGGAGTDQKANVDRLAWWGNRFGVVVRPAWPNWPNWHNWHNWGNGGCPNHESDGRTGVRRRPHDRASRPARPARHPADAVLQPRLYATATFRTAQHEAHPPRDARARLRARGRRAASSRRPFTVVWHAGEPMVLPPAFYEGAFATVGPRTTEPACPVSHSFQTNADADRRRLVRVPPALDRARGRERRRARLPPRSLPATPASGQGTHARVVRGMDMLRRSGIPFHVITVLTR